MTFGIVQQNIATDNVTSNKSDILESNQQTHQSDLVGSSSVESQHTLQTQLSSHPSSDSLDHHPLQSQTPTTLTASIEPSTVCYLFFFPLVFHSFVYIYEHTHTHTH
jgi:hypothetical protein